jgi:hypothetical protein
VIRRTSAFLALIVAGVFSASPAHSQSVTVHLTTIAASNQERGIDGRLGPLSGQLTSLFQYAGYRMLDQHTLNVSGGREGSAPLPPDRRIIVTPRGVQGGMVNLNVVIRSPDRVILNTDFRIANNGTVLVGGPRFRDGVLIIALRARF